MSTSNKPAKADTGVPKPAAAKKKLRVYVGPTINGFSAVRNRTYIGELPVLFQKAVEENRWMANLLTAPDDVSDARRSIRNQSGSYWEAYKRAKALLDAPTGGKTNG